MLISTTPTLQGHTITQYHGIVCGEVIHGAHIGKDLLAGLTNLVGGRSESYESTIRQARDDALREMITEAERLGSNAVVGVKFDYQVIGQSGSMMMVGVSGTGVTTA